MAVAVMMIALASCVGNVVAFKTYCQPGASCYPTDSEMQTFAASLSGSLVSPSSPMWANASHLLNPLVAGNHTPAHVVMATTAHDVMVTVRFVKQYNLLMSVKSTGHCYTGNCQAPKSFTLDLSRMAWVTANENTAIIGPGAVFDTVYKAVHDVQKLVVGGMCPTVGFVGYSLGGGHGALVRSFGLGADNIVDLTIVTANSTLIKVNGQGTQTLHPYTGEVLSESEDTSLWWALRGGGGGAFGVVVNATVQLHAAPAEVSYAQCYYPMNTTAPGSPGYIGPAILKHYFDTVANKSFSTKWGIYLFSLATPVPFAMPSLNSTQHGVIAMEGFFLGSVDEAQAAFAPLSDFHPEWQLSCAVKPISSFLDWHNTRWFGKGFPYRATQASRFPQSSPDTDTASLANVVSDMTLGSVEFSLDSFCGILLGGEVASPDNAATSSISPAFRGASMVLEADATWIFESQDAANAVWATTANNAMGAVEGVHGSYVNEALIDLPDWENEFWGNGFDKLQAIKDQWDPTGVFYCGHCVYGSNQTPPP